MHATLDRFYALLNRPLLLWSRWLLVLAVVPLVWGAFLPLWHIHFEAPQYPKGLDLYVRSYTIEGGNEGRDLPEINTLNHYVGMKRLDPADFADLDFIPFAIGGLALLALRVAVIGDVRALIDLAVLTGYFGAFSLGRFAYMLYRYGHDLDPKAPIRMEAFMPPILGTQEMGNFTVSSFPDAGTWLIGAFAAIVMGLALWHLVQGMRAAEQQGVRRAAA
jgi:copper chaperone NosL